MRPVHKEAAAAPGRGHVHLHFAPPQEWPSTPRVGAGLQSQQRWTQGMVSLNPGQHWCVKPAYI